MPATKLMVLYPQPTDPQEFDRVYRDEHVPLAMEGLKGFTRAVISRAVGAPDGRAAYHLVVELHYPSMEALQAIISSEGARKAIGHAARISTGGPPVVMIAEEDVVVP